jgi:hypothetical protein
MLDAAISTNELKFHNNYLIGDIGGSVVNNRIPTKATFLRIK